MFDYNNTKKYRVLIPTNKQIINLDKKGKKVFGWKHQKQTESINNTLEHFKIKNKDFIISQSENEIKLLAINGSERLKFDISIINNSLQRDDYGNLFAITNDLKLWQGDINGLSTIINVSEIDSNSLLQIIDNNIVISFENKLKILNKKLEEVGDYKLDSKIIRIGDNSIIAGQVGIAGSSILGNNVRIGGQAGISGHLTIGNNVEIAGGSGVIKNISDNSKVMGYPAKNIRDFLKDNK